MQPATSPWRSLRLALFLALFNAGALWALLAGAPAGALLAWAGLVGLLRLGLRPAAIALEGRFSPALRWGALLVAAAAALGCLDTVGRQPSGSLLLAGVAAALVLADLALARREAPEDRDAQPLVTATLVAIAAAQLPALAGHPAGAWVLAVAALAAAAAALTVVVAALAGTTPGQSVATAPLVPALDGLVARAGRPAVLCPALGVAFLAGGVHVVPTSHQAVIERFGAPLAEPADAGLLLRLPPPIERVVLVDVGTVRQVPVADLRHSLLCGDQSMVSVEATLHWRVADAGVFAYGVADPDAALAALARSALVEAVAHRGVDEVLTTGRAALEAEAATAAQRAAEDAGLGVAIEGLHIATAAVPPQVTDAFLEVISAQEEQRATVNQAEAYAADVLPRARGRALASLELAQGEAARIAAQGEAERARFQALHTGGAAAPDLVHHHLSHEAATRALGPARLVLVSPGIQPWLGGHPASPRPAGPAGSKKER